MALFVAEGTKQASPFASLWIPRSPNAEFVAEVSRNISVLDGHLHTLLSSDSVLGPGWGWEGQPRTRKHSPSPRGAEGPVSVTEGKRRWTAQTPFRECGWGRPFRKGWHLKGNPWREDWLSRNNICKGGTRFCPNDATRLGFVTSILQMRN